MTKKELLESKAFMEAPDDAYIEMPNGHYGLEGNTWFMSTEEMMKRQELCNKVFDLTTEVDEYLKKME